ncbi:hypothetical protein D9757_011560 [Collybiopsis confluens]|uniref:Uncharacterized protein n=1 Tax=Collybiopsis confluens TaxID=2823264 RepID=A0A8H5LLG7_9AGAR|nr:hypothetical protein D9757_011560 [Collybiopsis confluens]
MLRRKTIYALSTPMGKAGVAVIRISGPGTLQVWNSVLKSSSSKQMTLPEPWKMQRCQIVHPEGREVLDDGLAVFFKSPRSFTTEDVLELHIHSGRAIISSVLAALSVLPFCRPAEPGEFTRRAFTGGRLDLTQVEGLKDLIDAETESQRRLALQAAGGTSRAKFEHLRSEIIHCLAMVEALIDFGEGEDLEEGVFEQARVEAIQLNKTIQRHLEDGQRGEIIRSGVRLAIFGPPNAGKSSLLNFLAQREAAIVTSVPGTTRDILELSLDIGGLPLIVADTAGLRATDDLVETIGIERAKHMQVYDSITSQVQGSNVALCVLSLSEIYDPTTSTVNIPSSIKDLVTPETCFLLNKSDLLALSPPEKHVRNALGKNTWIASLETGHGTIDFLKRFEEMLKQRYDTDGPLETSTPVVTHARHRTHLVSASQFIESFLEYSSEDIVLGAEELRYAAQAVGKISGLIDVEDILDAGGGSEMTRLYARRAGITALFDATFKLNCQTGSKARINPRHATVGNIESQSFIDRILALPKGPGVSLDPVLQPSLDDETELRRLFATDKNHTRLKDPYVNLVDVFSAPQEIRTIRARVLKSDDDLDAKYVMPLSPKDRKAEGSPATTASLEEFQKNWAVFSEGSLSQLLDWNNVVAAGGSVLACLMPLPEEAKVSKRATRKYYHATAYPTSDIDLFLWGLTPEQAEAKIVKIYEAVRDSVPWDVTCVRTKHTVSIHSQYPYRSVQIVLRLYSSPAEILTGFDIDAPCCTYDGSRVWANPRAIAALMRQCNTVDVTRRSPSYEVRLTKYSTRGFEVYVPNLSRADIDPTIFERSIVRIEGLARLLVFEKLKDADTRARFLMSRRVLRGRPHAQYSFYRRKKSLKGDLKNQEAIGGLEMNDYDVVSLHIPYGPGWDAKRIDKLVYQTDLGMNSTFNPKNKDRRLHRHPAFFGNIQECIEDCCECCPKPIDEDERKLQEEEDKQFIRGRIAFIEEDPGRQSLSGSFNPIDDTEWSTQVYLGPLDRFFQAITALDRVAVAQMITEGLDVNRRDHVGRMPLHVAVLAKAEDIACDLVDADARISSRLADGKTALHWAAQMDQVKVVRKLLERSKLNEQKLKKEKDDEDPDILVIDAPDWDLCFTPLNYALLYASMPIIDLLLEEGADPQLVVTSSYPQAPKLHPLLLTMYRSDEEQAVLIIERLLKAGAVSSSADETVQTILHKMIAAGKTKLVQVLLKLDPKARVVLNLPSMTGQIPTFPLITAHQLNNYGMVATLLAYGAKPVFDIEDVTLAQDLLSQQQQSSGLNHFYYGHLSAEPLDRVIHPVEAGVYSHSDLIQLFIALGAPVNRAIRNSLSTYVSPETLRSYLDWVRFAISWMEKGITEQKEKMDTEVKTLSFTDPDPSPWKAFIAKTVYIHESSCVPGSEEAQKKIEEVRVQAQKEIRKFAELKEFFKDVERLLVSKGAKTYNELFPNSEKPSTATAVVNAQVSVYNSHQNSSSSRYAFMGQVMYSRYDPVPSHLNEKYDQLYEACWKGDNDSVGRLCLPEEAKQNALRVSVTAADPTNAWKQYSRMNVLLDVTPLAVAIQGRHWSTVRLVFCICVAQYKPAAEKEVAFKLGKIRLEDDDDDDGDASDDDSQASEETFAPAKNNQPFIDVSQVSPAVKVPFSPSRLLLHASMAHESSSGHDSSPPLMKAVRMKDFEAFVQIANLYKLTEPPIDIEESVLDAILATDQPNMLDEYIRRTGRNIELESGDADDTIEQEIQAINDKNKLYLGLSVHGKKRKDLAKKNDPDAQAHSSPQSSAPILFRAILSSATKIVEYLDSPRPLEAYRFYAMTNSNETAIRLRRRTDLDKDLPALLGWRTDFLGESPLTAAILSQKLDIIKLLFVKTPKLMSAALKARIKFSGWSPLMVAIQVGCSADTIDFLLANGQSPIDTDQVQSWNIYHMLASRDRPDLLEHLLKKLPLDISEALLVQQSKPLHIALSSGHHRVSSMIIDHTKASLMIRNVSGSTPLHMATFHGRAKIVQKLVEACPPESLFSENGVGNTPLEIATLLDLPDRIIYTSPGQSPELGAQNVNTEPPRFGELDALSKNVLTLRETISQLSKEGVLKPGEKLAEELSAFARLMETKLVGAKAEAAEEEEKKKKKEPKSESELESEKWNDPIDRSETLKIVQEVVLARPMMYRQLVHVVDVQKSVGDDLDSAMEQPTDMRSWHQQKMTDQQGLEIEEENEDVDLRNGSLVYQRLGQPQFKKRVWRHGVLVLV